MMMSAMSVTPPDMVLCRFMAATVIAWWPSIGSLAVHSMPFVAAVPGIEREPGTMGSVGPGVWCHSGSRATMYAIDPPFRKNWLAASPTSSASQSTPNSPPNSRS